MRACHVRHARALGRKDQPVFGGKRSVRGGEDGFRHLPPHVDDRPNPARSGAGDARSLLYGFVEQLGPPCFGREHRSGRPARALRQPLQGSGVVVESLLRFLDASLSSHDALGGGSTAPDRRSRRAHATKGGVLFPPALECALTLELRDDQPRSGARDPCHERREPRAGHESASPRHGEVRRSPESQSDRRVGL